MNKQLKTFSVELLQQPQTNNGLSLNIAELNRIITLLDQPFDNILNQLDRTTSSSSSSENSPRRDDADKNRNFSSVHMRTKKDAAKVNEDLDNLLASLSQYQIADSTNYISNGSEYLYNGQIVTSKPPPPKKPLPVTNTNSACDSLFISGSTDLLNINNSKPALNNINQLSSNNNSNQSSSVNIYNKSPSNNSNQSEPTQPSPPTTIGSSVPICLKCQEPVYENSIAALGGYYHAEHFTCTSCDTELREGVYYINNEHAYCEPCHINLFTDKCAYCGDPILDTALTALDQQWHPEHFFCSNCQCQFEDDVGFHEHQGKPYCGDCYFDTFGPRCEGCQTPITGTFLNAMGVKWHPECFVCKTCGNQFESLNFREYKGEPYCETHYHAITGSICGMCNKPIVSSTMVSALRRRYHHDCFRCGFCQRVLSRGSFKEHQDKAYCLPCYNKLLRP